MSISMFFLAIQSTWNDRNQYDTISLKEIILFYTNLRKQSHNLKSSKQVLLRTEELKTTMTHVWVTTTANYRERNTFQNPHKQHSRYVATFECTPMMVQSPRHVYSCSILLLLTVTFFWWTPHNNFDRRISQRIGKLIHH